MSDEPNPTPHNAVTPDAAAQKDEQQQELVRQRKRLRLAVALSCVAVCMLVVALILVVVVERGRRQAVAHGREMDAARGEMELQKEAVQDRLYVASMMSMTDDMLKNRASATRATLNSLRPAPGERDRRGWEWYYTDTVLNPGQEEALVSDRPLRAMAVSPDEREVAVAGDEGRISLWSAGSLEKQTEWEAQGNRVNGLAWNSQGLLAAALDDGNVAVWEVAKRHEIARWKAHERAVTSVIWHPRDPMLVSGGLEGAISVWQPTGGDPTHTSSFKGPVLSMDFRPDGKEMAAILGNPSRVVVGIPGGISNAEQVPLNSNGSALAWQPVDGSIALSMDGAPVRRWNAHTGVRTSGLSHADTPGATAFSWSAQGSALATGGVDGGILLASQWDDDSNVLHGHQGRVAALHWLKRRDRLLSIGDDGTLRAWDEPRRPTEVYTLRLPCTITAAQWNPTRDLLAVLLANDEVQVLDGTTHQMLWARALPRPADLDAPMDKGALAWSPDGGLLAAGCAGRALSLWQAGDGVPAGHIGTVMAEKVGWMPDGRRMLIRDSRGWMTLSCDGAAGRLGLPSGMDWLVPLKDGRMVSLTTDGEEVHLRTVGAASPALDVALPKMNGRIVCLAVNPDHTAVALGGENGTVAWFDSRTERWSRPAMTHAGLVVAVGWNGDGSRLATVGTDLTCRIYNAALAAESWLINYGMNPDISAIGWNARGDKLMVACAAEHRIKIYDAARSMDRESGRKHAPADRRLVDACAAIALNPGDGMAWRDFSGLVKNTEKDRASPGGALLLAAAGLGEKGLFELTENAGNAGPVLEQWQGLALPPAVQIMQCGVLKRWDQMATLCIKHAESPGGVAWMRRAHAEALSRLGRKAEAESQWLQAWQAQREEWVSEAERAAPAAVTPIIASHPSLAPWANILPRDDWTGSEKNNLADLRGNVKQPGYEFVTGPFVQLAGRVMRATHEHMFPRMTDWMPLGRPAHRVAFMVAVACYSPPNAPSELTPPGTCVGSLHLRRGSGGAVRIPLLYGRNIWDWWVPSNEAMPPAPPEAVAWTGTNAKARSLKHTLALYRVEWEAAAGDAAVTDFSIDSTMHRPAPMLMAVEVVR